ncbi:hypothetical protein Pmani_037657 [Petrolisthes manimaculis]|uniref:Uncharacterized protein n=1 Tax=Petrolisthes manimaculis TaxID=1843537 RepID=A0AAE1TKX8_9EUCA|nr:hypothetical protein Pmani_037657 [Petrolisthes manimaculis]
MGKYFSAEYSSSTREWKRSGIPYSGSLNVDYDTPARSCSIKYDSGNREPYNITWVSGGGVGGGGRGGGEVEEVWVAEVWVAEVWVAEVVWGEAEEVCGSEEVCAWVAEEVCEEQRCGGEAE